MLTRSVLVVLLCLSVSAQEVGKVPRIEGKKTGPLLFSISSDKENYRAEDTITIASELLNISDHDVRITMRDPLEIYSMDVRLPGPAGVPFHDKALMTEEGNKKKYLEGSSSHTARVLKPGEALQQNFELNSLYVMTVPGKYTVTFYFAAPDSVAKGQYVVSNQVTLSIAEKNAEGPPR